MIQYSATGWIKGQARLTFPTTAELKVPSPYPTLGTVAKSTTFKGKFWNTSVFYNESFEGMAS
jgi:hypothetical protein